MITNIPTTVIVLFSLAIFFYLLGNTTGTPIGVIGLVLELFAFSIWIASNNNE